MISAFILVVVILSGVRLVGGVFWIGVGVGGGVGVIGGGGVRMPVKVPKVVP